MGKRVGRTGLETVNKLFSKFLTVWPISNFVSIFCYKDTEEI